MYLGLMGEKEGYQKEGCETLGTMKRWRGERGLWQYRGREEIGREVERGPGG